FSEAYENGTAMDLDSIPPLPLGSLQELLRAMQREPHWRPQAADFQITAADVAQFRTGVAQLQHSPFTQTLIDEEQRRYLLSMPDSFYTASPVRLSNAVRMGKYLKERLGNCQFKVTFTDVSGENLTFTCAYFQQASYLLPWQVEANHHHNMSYHLAFSRFWQQHLPPNFTGVENFDPGLLFWSMEAYLRRLGYKAP
ncbi:MAG: hypothetical protein ACFB10_25520, partial [Salibacteraceae bacterium]